MVVADEVYEHLVFDGLTHTPIATLPGMRERTVTISSAGKTFSVTGWKIGWICAPAPLVTAVRSVKQFLTFVNGAPFQPAVAQALRTRGEDSRPRRRCSASATCSVTGWPGLGFDVVRPAGHLLRHRRRRARRRRVLPRAAPKRAGVVAIPSSVFYDSARATSYVRFAFCKQPPVLALALNAWNDSRGPGRRTADDRTR